MAERWLKNGELFAAGSEGVRFNIHSKSVSVAIVDLKSERTRISEGCLLDEDLLIRTTKRDFRGFTVAEGMLVICDDTLYRIVSIRENRYPKYPIATLQKL